MSYTSGTMLRNGFTDSAIVLNDGSIYELKRDGRAFNNSNKEQRRTFVDVASWQASLSNVEAITTETRSSKAKASLTSRVFQYSTDMSHSEIAVDLMRHFKSETFCRVDSAKIWQQDLIKAKISLLKLELDPPVFDEAVRFHTTVEGTKEYIASWLNICTSRIAEYNTYPNSTVYIANIMYLKPKVFVSCGNEIVPLGVHEASGHIVLNRTGYKTFADAAPCGSDGMPEFWAFCNNKLTKLNVSVAEPL